MMHVHELVQEDRERYAEAVGKVLEETPFVTDVMKQVIMALIDEIMATDGPAREARQRLASALQTANLSEPVLRHVRQLRLATAHAYVTAAYAPYSREALISNGVGSSMMVGDEGMPGASSSPPAICTSPIVKRKREMDDDNGAMVEILSPLVLDVPSSRPSGGLQLPSRKRRSRSGVGSDSDSGVDSEFGSGPSPDAGESSGRARSGTPGGLASPQRMARGRARRGLSPASSNEDLLAHITRLFGGAAADAAVASPHWAHWSAQALLDLVIDSNMLYGNDPAFAQNLAITELRFDRRTRRCEVARTVAQAWESGEGSSAGSPAGHTPPAPVKQVWGVGLSPIIASMPVVVVVEQTAPGGEPLVWLYDASSPTIPRVKVALLFFIATLGIM
ncbi:uncharacterized protein AMSG_11155 [Thecamonas trahens ATCC 50062]|uniref:Uncharacterized protein n=1 Tax=Thecamonas trahens ATCC 50062 TaxID=461836 RepID=A0A0L0DU86_THETB|nr:hypothetical protein AMSG_11155 [Thecamonas trahens ATCC 50062]KNC55757.1 hypothetical protein AMSG_11155 [Thecamonas trahens ATCC 50062]|eukprot:XP_013752909.1 hypothetical protein AMSG_11155 [Thecamonas trahens ATCC 50062]